MSPVHTLKYRNGWVVQVSIPRLKGANAIQAANILQLFTFIKHDLMTYRPKENELADLAASSFDPVAGPSFPKSLYLIWPLVSSHELGPVAPTAQASVPVPEGLDLDVWIVPAMQEPFDDDDSHAVEKKVKKSKKGKGKETPNRTRAKGGKKKHMEDSNMEELVPEEPEETAEERAERERVSLVAGTCVCLTRFPFQLKAERLERMKEDPYYITDERPTKTVIDDVDSIPVVRLDDLLPLQPKGDVGS